MLCAPRQMVDDAQPNLAGLLVGADGVNGSGVFNGHQEARGKVRLWPTAALSVAPSLLLGSRIDPGKVALHERLWEQRRRKAVLGIQIVCISSG